MTEFKAPLAKHFSSLRENPKWGLKLLFTLLIIGLSSVIGSFAIDYHELFKNSGIEGQQLEQSKMIGQIGGAIGGIFTGIMGIFFMFIIFLLISKIMRSDVGVKPIFSATLSYTLITGIIGFIVITIQWAVGLSLTDYTITSLNIFDKGNKILEVFNIQTCIGAYIFGVMLFSTSRISKGAAIIWGVVYLLLSIGFGLLGAILS